MHAPVHTRGPRRSPMSRPMPTSVPRSMPRLLLAIGLHPEEVLGRGSLSKMGVPREVYMRVPEERSFWNRVPDLDTLGDECKRAYRRTAKQIRPDLCKNHEAGVMLNRCWQKIKRIFAYHGVRI